MVDTSAAVQSANSLLSFEGIECPAPSDVRRWDPIFEFTEAAVHWAYSSVGLEHTPDKREVGSSNLPRPTIPHVGL